MPSTQEWLPGDPPVSGAGNFFNMKALKEYEQRTADLRIMAPLVNGWVVWCKDGKPHRAARREDLPPQAEWRIESGKQDQPKPFWAGAVRNVTKGKWQVWEFTQGTVYRQLKALLDNKRWGPWDAYDISIKSEGEGLQVKYTITPNPKEPMFPTLVEEWERLQATWTGPVALFNGGDPFAAFDGVPF